MTFEYYEGVTATKEKKPMSNKMKKSKFATETDKILLECLANIQKSIRDYQRDVKESLEELKFSIETE